MTKHLVEIILQWIVDQHFARMAAKNRLPTKFPKVTTQRIVNQCVILAKEETIYL